jgi:hypothetical protein
LRQHSPGQDIARLVPTAGDAFKLTVTGTAFAERKLAGRARIKEILTLVQLKQEGDTVIAEIASTGSGMMDQRPCGRGRRRQ